MSKIKVVVNSSDISKFVSKVTWSGQDTEVCRQLSFEVVNSPFDKNMVTPIIETGDSVKFYYDSKLLFLGQVLQFEKKDEAGTTEYTAYDMLYSMIHSEATYKFKKKTPEYICRKVCKDFGLSVGAIEKTKHVIKKYYPSAMSPYAIILKAYQKAEKSTKKKYMIKMSSANLKVIKKGSLISSIKLTSGTNIESASYTEDATNVINKIAVYNSKGDKIGNYQDKESIKNFGIIQSSVNVDKGKGKKESKSKLTKTEKSASLTAIGNINCISGYGIEISDEDAYLDGVYYIKSDSHEFADGMYTMTLDLNFKNEDEEIEYSAIDENAKTSTNADGSVTKTVTHTYDAIFTAYSETTGNRKDAQGNALKASKHTCAMGSRIALGSKVTCDCPGTSIDKKTYRVTDRPKNAKLQGRWHVDILFKTDAEAHKFGVRKGKVKIITKTVISKNGSNKDGNAIVKKAESKIGCKYVWGASGPDTFDCSGLVWWCHKQCGINFGRTDTRGLSKMGKEISLKEAEPGDVLIFSSNGAYSGIHHTGIYIGGGEMIHAPNSKESVKKSGISAGYYKRQLFTIRRIR